MTTPITPMSASTIIAKLERFRVPLQGTPISHGDALHVKAHSELVDFVRQALASHLVHVKDKAQKVADNNPEYYNAYAHGFDDCLAVLQSEIDELTK